MVLKRTSEKEMLNAALTIFSSKGYSSATVSDIIEQAGVARGTFYLYFESKHNAFSQVLAHVLEKIENIGPDTGTSNHFHSAEDLYKRIFSTYVRFLSIFKDNSSFARIVFTEATGLDKGFDQQLQGHYGSHRKNIKKFLRGVRASGLARDFDLDIMTQAIIGYTQHCARVYLSEEGSVKPVKKLASELADLEFSSICKYPLNKARSKNLLKKEVI